MRPVGGSAVVLVLALSACTSSGAGDAAAPAGRATGVGSFNAAGVQPVATDPCPSTGELLAAPASGPGSLPAADLECIGAEGSSARVPMAQIGRVPSVVNLWASWCKPCVKEMPDLQQVHRAASGRVRFLGVNTNDSVAGARARIGTTGVTYPQVADPDASIRSGVGAPGLPATLFIDAGGRIVHRQFGPMDAKQLRELIAKHLLVQL